MRTAEQYIDSLRQRPPRLFVDGELVPDPTTHPKVAPSINSVAMTYALAHDPEHAALATAASELTGGPVSRFTHLFLHAADLVRKVELQRVLGRLTGTCFQRCVGLDGLNALFIATWQAGPEPHARFVRWLTGVQERDDVVCGAMTDAKGNRRERPTAQPDSFVRVVQRRDDGVVIRGAKVHQTGGANSHQLLVMPGGALRPGEEDFAIACALPADTPGVAMVLGRQPSDGRRGGPDAGNARFGGQEVVILFDDVFVPAERVFLDGDLAACGTLLEAFAGYHRASCGGSKPECMHGAGSPAAQRIVLERSTDWAERVAHARRLAGLDEATDPLTRSSDAPAPEQPPDPSVDPRLDPEPGWLPFDPPHEYTATDAFVGHKGPHRRFRARWYRDPQGAMVGKALFGPGSEGPPGHVHGGAITTVLDQAMGGGVWLAGHVAVAGQLTVRFRSLARTGLLTRFRGEIGAVDGRKISARAVLEDASDGRVIAEAEGLFITIDPAQIDPK